MLLEIVLYVQVFTHLILWVLIRYLIYIKVIYKREDLLILCPPTPPPPLL